MQRLKKYKRRWGIMPNSPKTNWALTLLRKQPEKQHVHKDSENLRRMGEMMEKEETIAKKVFIEVFIFKNGFNEINHRLADHFSLHLTKHVTRKQIAILNYISLIISFYEYKYKFRFLNSDFFPLNISRHTISDFPFRPVVFCQLFYLIFCIGDSKRVDNCETGGNE